MSIVIEQLTRPPIEQQTSTDESDLANGKTLQLGRSLVNKIDIDFLLKHKYVVEVPNNDAVNLAETMLAMLSVGQQVESKEKSQLNNLARIVNKYILVDAYLSSPFEILFGGRKLGNANVSRVGDVEEAIRQKIKGKQPKQVLLPKQVLPSEPKLPWLLYLFVFAEVFHVNKENLTQLEKNFKSLQGKTIRVFLGVNGNLTIMVS